MPMNTCTIPTTNNKLNLFFEEDVFREYKSIFSDKY